MPKYKSGETTFICLTDQERLALTATLEACETFAQSHAMKGWNNDDKYIFTGMLKLNGTLGHLSPFVAPFRYGLAIDPTAEQYQKANMAVRKMMADHGTSYCANQGVQTFTHSHIKGVLDNEQQRNRQEARRDATIKWIQDNEEALVAQYAIEPRLLDHLLGDAPVNTAEQAHQRRIREIIAPKTLVPQYDHSDLGDLWA